MRCFAIATAVLLAAACSGDDRARNAAITEPRRSVSPEAVKGQRSVSTDTVKGKRREVTHIDVDARTGVGHARTRQFQDLSPKEQTALKWFADPANSPNALVRAWDASVKRGPPAYAVSKSNLPEGAAAYVIRDPASATPRLILVSESSVDDVVLAMAQHALRVSETGYPTISQRRTIALWKDQRFRITSEDGTREGRLDFNFMAPERRKEANKLLARAASARQTSLRNVGSVSLVLP
jgi:hypothetical protein